MAKVRFWAAPKVNQATILRACQNLQTGSWRLFLLTVDPQSRARGPVCYVSNGEIRKVRGLCAAARMVTDLAQDHGWVGKAPWLSTSWGAEWPRTKQSIEEEQVILADFWDAVEFLVAKAKAEGVQHG